MSDTAYRVWLAEQTLRMLHVTNQRAAKAAREARERLIRETEAAASVSRYLAQKPR
jgi:chromosome condensin MukBEF MukE localization factor